MGKKRIAVLASGKGTNLQSIMDSIDSGFIDNGEIAVVISDKKDAYALERARKKGIEALWINPARYDSCEEFDDSIAEELEKRAVNLVVLAGYIRILSPGLVRKYYGRIVNVHPSLIPSFCGKGYYGEKVHKAVLDYGVKVTGATVHFVDEGTDTGPIILQEAIEVKEDDTVDTLAKRVLEVEHRLLPLAVKLFCQDRLIIEGRKVRIRNW